MSCDNDCGGDALLSPCQIRYKGKLYPARMVSVDDGVVLWPTDGTSPLHVFAWVEQVTGGCETPEDIRMAKQMPGWLKAWRLAWMTGDWKNVRYYAVSAIRWIVDGQYALSWDDGQRLTLLADLRQSLEAAQDAGW